MCFLTSLLLCALFADWLLLDARAWQEVFLGGLQLSTKPDSSASLTFQHWLLATRQSLLTAGAVAVLSLPLGVVFGSAAALWPRLFRGPLTLAVELAGALPSLIIVGLWTLAPGNRSLLGFTLLIALLRSVGTSRLVAEQTRQVLQQNFALASQALGGTKAHIFAQHVWPKLAGVLAVDAVGTAVYVVGLEGALGLVGLQVPGQLSWGGLLGRVRDNPDPLVWVALGCALLTALALDSLVPRARLLPR
jgi:peptide/nickel transport system permease protein